MTNGDHIRQGTDDEIAALYEVARCGACEDVIGSAAKNCEDYEGCYDCIKEWLGKESEGFT